MSSKNNSVKKKKNSLRTHKYVFTLNDEEDRALNRYFEKYKIQNKSRFIRETLIFSILKRFEEDQPTLFD